MSAVRQGLFMIAELALRPCVAPRLRARLVGLLGARIGRNVRIYECRFANLQSGFSNLEVHDDVHIGPDTLIDLRGPVVIGRGTSVSPRVSIISHADPGAAHGSDLCLHFPPEANGVQIGSGCWIGAGAIILSGTRLGDGSVIGAGAVVRGACGGHAVYAGVPARKIRDLESR